MKMNVWMCSQPFVILFVGKAVVKEYVNLYFMEGSSYRLIYRCKKPSALGVKPHQLKYLPIMRVRKGFTSMLFLRMIQACPVL
jgi:hypothetical protein